MSRFWWIIFAIMAGGLLLLIALDLSGAMPGLDNDGLAQLLYLGVLATVIGAGVLGSQRHRLGDTIRMLGIWALVILVLVVGYQYRTELYDIASRLTGGLI